VVLRVRLDSDAMSRRRAARAGVAVCLVGLCVGFVAAGLGLPLWAILLGVFVLAWLSRPFAAWLTRAPD
jgi:hypothetical protein